MTNSTTETPARERSVHAISNPESQWARHVGDSHWHVIDEPRGGSVPTRCNGRWPEDDTDVDYSKAPPFAERCGACQESLVQQRFGQLAHPAHYDWPSGHDLGGES